MSNPVQAEIDALQARIRELSLRLTRATVMPLWGPQLAVVVNAGYVGPPDTGPYFDGYATLAISPPDPIHPRKDTIYVHGRQLGYLYGIPSPAPVPPILPAGAQALAIVTLQPGATKLEPADIEERNAL